MCGQTLLFIVIANCAILYNTMKSSIKDVRTEGGEAGYGPMPTKLDRGEGADFYCMFADAGRSLRMTPIHITNIKDC